MNPMDLKRGVEMAVHTTVDDLKKRTKKIKSSMRSLKSARSQPMETRKSAT